MKDFHCNYTIISQHVITFLKSGFLTLSSAFERYRNLGKWNVLELECEMGGGLEYISKNLKARRAVGITSNDRKV